MRSSTPVLTLAACTTLLFGCSSSPEDTSTTSNATSEPAAVVTESNTSTETLVGGISKPEDLVTIPGTSWVLVSSMSSEKLGMEGGLFAVDSTVGDSVPLWPSTSAETQWNREAYPTCPGEPDMASAEPHGINVEPGAGDAPDTLYAINHGRHSVEVFDLDTSNESIGATWVGCIPIPDNVSANGVAPLPDGSGIVVSSMFDPTVAGNPFERMFTGVDTGQIMKWTRGSTWEAIPNSELGGANGVAVSEDGQYVLAAGWTQRKVVKIPLNGTADRTTLELPFLPDNLRWTDRGTVLVTGHDVTIDDVTTCNAGEGTDCPSGYSVFEIDPETMTSDLVVDGSQSEVSLATTAVQVGSEIWVGSITGDRIYRVDAS